MNLVSGMARYNSERSLHSLQLTPSADQAPLAVSIPTSPTTPTTTCTVSPVRVTAITTSSTHVEPVSSDAVTPETLCESMKRFARSAFAN